MAYSLLLALSVGALWTAAEWSANSARDTAAALALSQARVDAAQQLKFRVTDVSGWQAGYAFNIVRGAPGATADSAPERSAFLAAMDSFLKELDDMAALPLTPGEEADVATIRSGFQRFQELDDRVIAGYRAGTPARVDQANKLVAGPGLDLYAVIAGGVDRLLATAREQEAVAHQEAEKTADRTSGVATLVGSLSLFFAVVLTVLISLSILRPLSALQDRLADIAEGDGDLTKRLETTGHDQFTDVSRSFNTFADKIAAAVRGIRDSAGAVAQASEKLTRTAIQIMVDAKATSRQSGEVVLAADEVAANVRTVAASTSSMGGSLQTITSTAAEVGQVCEQSMRAAHATQEVVGRLTTSSRQIGDIVKVISAIAQQTNLLALNATIEASRAGESGKGFAVVAGEVKTLAQDAGAATEDITAKVQDIQQDTAMAAEAVGVIVETTGRLGSFQSTISAAVREQAAATDGISEHITDSTTSSADIAASIATISTGAQTTTDGVIDIRDATQELSRLSNGLQALVGQFKI
ncbi:MAG: methyl-accepting chemotaxis protein [Actinomycetota bacterium]|nr:methyl-accepting chemotaxis protein [Actinomycetota bacterium]